MPTTTYTPLANITLGSSASSVTFSNIPNTYRDLILICYTLGTAADVAITGRLNTDAGDNYSTVRMFGTGSSTGSDVNGSNGTINRFLVGITNTTWTNQIVQILDYSATDKHKSILVRNNSTVNSVNAHAARWASTTAVNSVRILADNSAFATNSTFALYGVIA